MAGVNKVILVGNLGADPELRYAPSGMAIANFRIATTETWKDKTGAKQDKTEWHRIVAFGKLAEICGEYLNKGKQIYVEGKIQTRQWEDKDGNKRYTTEVVAQTMQMLGPAGEKGAASASGGAGASEEQPPAMENPPAELDDIPF